MMGNITVQELTNTTPEIQLVQDIAERCKHIETAVSTCVFGNLIRQYFENNEKELEEIENESDDGFADDELSLTFLFDEHFIKRHDGKHVSLQSVLRIVEIIAKDCFGRYKQLWDNYANETEHSITELRTMFLGVKDMDKEIRQAEKTCIFRLKPHTRNSLIRFSNLPSYGQTVDTIKVAAKTFKFDNKEDSLYIDTVQKFEGLLSGNLSGITLQDMTPILNQIDIVHNVINSDLQDILQALKTSSALLDFLREVADDDLRNLIDAVEEHSEQYVRESTVSDLIEIKRFFNPVLKGNFLENIGKLFELLQRQVENIGNNKIPEKIYICRDNLHSLKALYRNAANRGERTVEVIENIMQKGVFRFLLSSRACEVTTEYKQVKKKYKQSGADLSDLRSRALLLMNADDRDKSKSKSVRKDDLEKFVHIVDEAFEVAGICMQLKRAGHFEFSKYEENCRRENLNNLKCQLQHQYEEWISEIHACRKKFYYLNFLYADQLYELYSFLHNAKNNDVIVMAILRFIDPSIEDLQKITLIYDSFKIVSSGDHIAALENIGQTLEELYSGMKTNQTKFLECLEHTNLAEKVQPGVPYVTSLADGSPLVIRTLLALYLNTTGMFPQANQVLFCRKDTTFDEITLLLNRCIQKQSIRTPVKALYSIANIELLPSEVQFCLHNEIRRLLICSNGYDFLLCLLCRGHENHPFLDQFADILSRPSPLSDLKLKQYLVEQWSHVTVVTSDVPGLGKSEFIQRKAIADKKRPVCIHISGPFNRLSIIEELIKIRLKNYHVLHLDIGVISDPNELDLFMFEMIVLRYVSAGSTAYALASTSISIEIANTIHDELRDSLPTVTCFSRENLQWNCYSDLRVSSEINSPVQVVCHYLKGLDDGLIDTQDLYFTGTNALKPLTSTECARILGSHFEVSGDMSFTLMNIFINVLADQLKKLSVSLFFRTSSLKAMMEKSQRPTVKSNLVKALENVSMDFAARSVNACRSAQTASVLYKTTAIADILANRVSGMIRWEDSNHLVVLFHQNVQTVSALYRNVKDVPLSVRNLFESQVKSKLTDFKEKSTEELKHLLLKLTRNSIASIDRQHLALSMTKYALTPDNLLKMVLISLRVNSNVPVLIMGETGCGKTSLIRFLAKVCDVEFEVFTIHAGIEESDIIRKFSHTNQTAFQHLNDQFWLFLDEINTCNHLGLITDSLCHRMLLGTEIAPNLTILAACNPYRLRQEEEILTTGLQGKIGNDELSRLVYRVNPLPEALIDYVWDYGSLSEEDEKSYITKMVDSTFRDKKLTMLLTKTLVMSQHFVRNLETNDYCVSLRDVDRCRRLVEWFDNTFLFKKQTIQSVTDRKIRAVILGLTVCYHSRFSDGIIRRKYREEIKKCIWSTMSYAITEEEILDSILTEQKDILNMMTELPAGTALNAALQENVFMLLVCILNKIPIFLVGKPGCSKSLSMQLIRSNLRGKDSTGHLFQEMPQLFCVSFQGSESSTSDGIIKVFEKAEKYQKHNDERDVLSVVILDEIGLAEISKFNPLKVLHGLIERHDEQIKVAVVGISNWALDAAKMNRAIHLSRPDMDLEELIYTGKSISNSMMPCTVNAIFDLESSLDDNFGKHLQPLTTQLLEGIAKAYYEYCSHDQKFPNFHGLRDFYSLIKYLGRKEAVYQNADDEEICEIILTGIFRNFGGLPTEKNKIFEIFRKNIPGIKSQEMPVTRLIIENLQDKSCRHLMLITNGDAVISILESQLRHLGLPFDIIFGSSFQDDLTDAYNYRILSRIILCMEQGMVLILKDLESIYGSLYDMLNQNYTVVGKKKHCRVALGHYSNPMCHVHDDFKCVVLVEESKLDYSDPPFLNRFEKQHFEFFDLLENENLKKAVYELNNDIVNFCKIPNHAFSPNDVIPSYSTNLLVSLIIKLQQNMACTSSLENIKKNAFDTLLWLVPPEVVIRSKESVFCRSKSPNEFGQILNKYLELPIHTGLFHFLDRMCNASFDVIKEKTTEKSNISSTISKDGIENENSASTQIPSENTDYNGQASSCNILESKDNILSRQTLPTDVFEIKNALKEQLLQITYIKEQEVHGVCEYLYVIYTFSGINSFFEPLIQNKKIQREKLAIFKSEKQFSFKIDEFFQSDNNILVLQCSCLTDNRHLLLVKGIIEKYIRTHMVDMHQQQKHVCIVIHLERNVTSDIPLNFLSGWSLFFIDSIETPLTPLEHLLNVDKLQIVTERRPLDSYINKMLFWAFSRIKFTNGQNSVKILEDVMMQIKSCNEVVSTLEDYVLMWIKKTSLDLEILRTSGYEQQDFCSTYWCVDVAENPHELLKAGPFVCALENSISDIIRLPLAPYIFKLLEQNLLSPVFVEDACTPARRLIWRRVVLSDIYVNTDGIPLPSGPECYFCSSEPLNFYMPCSQSLMLQIDDRKGEFLDIIRRLRIDNDIDVDDELPRDLFDNATNNCIDIICFEAVSISEDLRYPERNKDFIRDFCNYFSVKILKDTDELERIDIFKWALSNFVDFEKIESVDFLTLVAYLNAGLWVYGHIINAICHIVKLCMYSVDLSTLNVAELICFQNTITGTTTKSAGKEKNVSMKEVNNTNIQMIENGSDFLMFDDQTDEMVEIKCLMEDMITSVALNDSFPSSYGDNPGSNIYSLSEENDDLTVCVTDSNEHGDTTSLSREHFMKVLCMSLLPTKQVFDTLVVDEWIALVRNILPLAHIINDECDELTALKFCQELTEDFVKKGFSIPVSCITELGRCIIDNNGKLGALAVCECLHSSLRKLQNEQSVKQAILQKLFCSYILRCMIASPENTDPLTFTLTKIKENEMFDPEMSYFGQVVKFAVIIDLNDNRDAYFNMLINEKSCTTNEIVGMCFDSYLVDLDVTDIKNMSLPILLLHVLESYAFEEYLTIEHLGSVQSSSDEILHCLSRSFQIIETEIFSLKFVVALAFVKKMLMVFVDLLDSTKYDCSAMPTLAQHINSIMTITSNTDYNILFSTETLHFFLKHINQRFGCQDIARKCQLMEPYIPVLKEVVCTWTNSFVEKSAVFNPLFLYLDPASFDMFLTQMKSVGSKNNTLHILLSERTDMLKFVGVLAQCFFMRKCLKENDDTEMQIAEQIAAMVDKANIKEELKSIINGLLGVQEFKHNLFNLSVMVRTPQPQISSVIVHMACIIGTITHYESFWNQTVFMPISSAVNGLPLIPFEKFEKEHELPEAFPGTSKVCCNIMQIFLHSSLVISFGLNKISSLNVLNLIGYENDNIDKQIRQYWQNLQQELQLNCDDMCILLHSILFNSLHLFTAEPDGTSLKESVNILMQKHVVVINEILPNRFAHIHSSKRHCALLCSEGALSVENCVTEVGPCNYNVNINSFTHLFRVYTKPTKESLFANLHIAAKNDFPVLHLVIDHMEKLSLPQKILSILKWHLSLVIYASYKFRKVDFKYMTITKLFAEENDDKKKRVLKTRFEAFKNDWNDIRSFHCFQSCDKDSETLEIMHTMLKMSSATIIGENSPLYRVVEKLIQIQNNFLSEACSTKSMKENPITVSLLEIRSKDLLNFKWSDRFLTFSQCDTRYGLDQKIDFDFEKIEQEIKAEVLFGKCFIKIQDLPQIVFSDELFQNTVELLKEIQRNVQQYDLTQDIKKEIVHKRDRDASQITNMLTQTGMVISLIRKTGADSAQPIVEYLTKWENVSGISSLELKNLLPEDIKIGHIIPFYQYLEELNGDNIANSLEDKYRVHLPREGRESLIKSSKGNFKTVEKLDHALKVFVHRCLSSSNNVIRPDQPLVDYICDEHFWWTDDFQNEFVLSGQSRIPLRELLSPTIQVEHIFETIKYIKDLLEDSKQKAARISGINSSYKTAKQTELPKRTRSKAAMKMMKT
ncbi:uncharacterized protein LOC127707898 [Mytilus californianus]|uniref:uncharacterized protein LOC127707898 n=1 Tax=Mytilus californianus TaxID=6549 RepID=UPI002246DCC6|nr:uncharacterized protein LOC127707898 [Mytilus californianus]